MRKYKPRSDDRFYDKFNASIVNVKESVSKIKNQLKELINIDDFSELHNQINENQSITGGELFKIFKKIDLNLIDEYIDNLIRPIIGEEEYLIQRTPNLRIVIPNQDKKGQLLFWHQGIWVGNGYGLRTIWTPLTDAYESNSLHMAYHETSIDATTQFYNDKWTYEDLSKRCEKICHSKNMTFGHALLFAQENLHGQRPNKTNKTRVSFECRILLKNGDFMHKLPGAYFRKPFVYYKKPMEKYENSIIMPQFDGPFFNNDTQYSQHVLMHDYVKETNVELKTECVELVTTNCAYAKFLAKNKIYDNFIFPSLFAFQENDLKDLFQNDVTFHFASENLICNDDESKKLALYYRTF